MEVLDDYSLCYCKPTAFSLGAYTDPEVNPLEKGMAPHSSILAWRIPWTEEMAGYSPWGHKELDTAE